MKLLHNIFRHAAVALVLILTVFLLVFMIKGDKANTGKQLAYQTEKALTLGGPFESPNSRSRYVLTEAIVENNKMTFTHQQAKFASPDVSRYNGQFFSIFMPGISFIGIPFYVLGKALGLPQLMTYLSVTLFGITSMILIAWIAFKLGVNKYASMLGGFLFLFATNALPYSLFLTQHVTSVTFILLSLLVAMRKPSVLNAVLFGVLVGVNILLDIPNIILLTPIGLYFLHKYISIQKVHERIKLAFNTKLLIAIVGLLPILGIMAWYNMQTTGTFTKIGQSVGQSSYFMEHLTKEQKAAGDTPTEAVPFNSRAQMSGLYTLLVSNERSWIFYSPIVFLGILGIIQLYKKRERQVIASVITGTILLNILLYGMFHDPWGGWSFGPRYLIPAAAMLCIGLAVAIQTYKTKIWFMVLFGIAAIYSIQINILGALTTSLMPPKHEALKLATYIPYTIEYNFQLANANSLSSLVYNLFFSTLPGLTYSSVLVGFASLIVLALYQLNIMARERSNHDN